MVKDKNSKQPSRKKAAKPRAKAVKTKSRASTRRVTVTKAVQGAKKKAAAIASSPAVTEIVAASLVAAAAAIKDPRKARSMAVAVGDELEAASKKAVNSGNAFWKLALDIAKRSIDALGPDSGAGKAKGARKTKTAKPKAAAKSKAVKRKVSGKPKTGSRKKAKK